MIRRSPRPTRTPSLSRLMDAAVRAHDDWKADGTEASRTRFEEARARFLAAQARREQERSGREER
jgi:hypothetical protein